MLQIKKGTIEKILNKDKRTVCFGAGSLAEFMLCSYPELLKQENFIFVDNNESKDGIYLCIQDVKIPIYSLNHFKQLGMKDFILIIVPVFFQKIVEQLDKDEYFEGIETYLYPLLSAEENKEKSYSIRNTDKPFFPNQQ